MSKQYYDADKLKQFINREYEIRPKKERMVMAIVTDDGWSRGIWIGSETELAKLMLTVSSTKLSFNVIKEGEL